jgi:hypothetical protein
MPETPIRVQGRHEVILPVSEEEFAKFVSGLLGKPQTIEDLFPGPFDLGKTDIENCFHLVDQRVKQQNKATLIQFSVKITYSDNSSVLLNSLDDFKSYREVKPAVSVAADLSWTYLIKFEDREVAEKQVIELSIATGGDEISFVATPTTGLIVRTLRQRGNGFVLRIQHTARTWGTDIENLIAGQIRSWRKAEPKLKSLVNKYSGWIGLGVGILVFALMIWGFLSATNPAISQFQEAAKAAAFSKNADAKFNFLVNASANNPLLDRRSYLGFIIVLGLIFGLV